MNNQNDTPKPSAPGQPADKGLDGAACSPSVSDTPETLKFTRNVRGTPLEKYWSAVGQMERMERERFTIEEIADYIAGWTLGSFDEVQKLGAHVARNALNQLRDDQDGIQAVRMRKLYQENT